MQLKKIFRKTELHLMSIRSKHQKLHHAVWNKYGKNSVHSVIHKWEMENYDLTQERCSCVLFMCCLYMHIFSIQPNTVLVYFIFKYIKKKPSVFPYHFIISEIWHPKNTKITGCLTLKFMNYTSLIFPRTDTVNILHFDTHTKVG